MSTSSCLLHSASLAPSTFGRTGGTQFDPAWRSNLVETVVAQLTEASDRRHALQEFLFQERDPFIRQAVRWRLTGSCVSEAFPWVYRAVDENAKTGLASTIKAMIVADRMSWEIATELSIHHINVAVFTRLFFDIEPILGNETVLRMVVSPELQEPVTTIEERRERLMLRTALNRGWPGVRALLRGEPEVHNAGPEQIAEQIEALAAGRALRFLRELDASGVPVSDEDLKRFALMRSFREKESVGKAAEMEQRFKKFHTSLIRAMALKAGEQLAEEDSRALQRFLPMASNDAYPEENSGGERRRRRAFPGLS